MLLYRRAEEEKEEKEEEKEEEAPLEIGTRDTIFGFTSIWDVGTLQTSRAFIKLNYHS